mgnify:FL=1
MTKKQEETGVVNPFSEKFAPTWELWKRYKEDLYKFKYKSSLTEQMALSRLVKISGGVENVAIEIIEEAISRQWEGLFALKTNNFSNGRNINGSDTAAKRESINEALNKRFAKGG